jgi:ribonuclease T2
MRPSRLLLTLLLTFVGPVLAAAQLGPGPGGRAPFANQPPPKNEAGRFDYYALVLSWSPTYCETNQRGGNDPQCNRRDGKRYSFVLHGLWPQHDKGWPEFCPIRGSTFVPQPLINRMLDIMPSPRLVIHQFRKHGTCSGLDQESYFGLSRKLFESVKIPPRFDRPNQQFTITSGEVERAFLEANPTMKPGHIVIDCGARAGRLREVRICFSREGRLRDCGGNETSRRLCTSDRITVPPVRAGAGR